MKHKTLISVCFAFFALTYSLVMQAQQTRPQDGGNGFFLFPHDRIEERERHCFRKFRNFK